MKFINKYVKRTEPYPLVSHQAWEKGNEGSLKLDWNEATVQPSPKVKEALLASLDTLNLNWYPDTNNQILKAKLCNYAGVPQCNLECFPSSDVAHEIITRTFIEAGDLVTIVAPTYDNFRSTVESFGALVNYFYLDENFDFDLEKFKAFLDVYESKLVYLCNPNNPTGSLYSKELLVDLIADYPNTLFLIDEAYFEFSGVTLVNEASQLDNVVVTRTLSKAFALASIRFGYVVASSKNIEYMQRIKNAKNIPVLTQIAAEAALDDIDYMNSYVQLVLESKQNFVERILLSNSSHKCVVVDGSGNFVMIKFDQSIKVSVIDALRRKKIYVRSYSHVIGMEDYVRITIGTCDQMEEVLSTICEYLS